MIKMGGYEMETRFIGTILLIALSLGTALFIELDMMQGILELVLLIIGVIAAAFVVYGLWYNTYWSGPATTILFSAFLANVLYLFLSTHALLPFIFALLVNVAGMVLSVMSVDFFISAPVETYDLEELPRAPRRRKRY